MPLLVASATNSPCVKENGARQSRASRFLRQRKRCNSRHPTADLEKSAPTEPPTRGLAKKKAGRVGERKASGDHADKFNGRALNLAASAFWLG